RDQGGLTSSRRTIEQITSMVRDSQLLVSLFRSPKLPYVFQQVFLFSRLQNYRCQSTRQVALYVIPPFVVNVKVRLHTLSLKVAIPNIPDEAFHESSIPSERSEHQRFHAPASSFVCILSAREPHFKRPAAVPEPMSARRRNHSYALVAHRG